MVEVPGKEFAGGGGKGSGRWGLSENLQQTKGFYNTTCKIRTTRGKEKGASVLPSPGGDMKGLSGRSCPYSGSIKETERPKDLRSPDLNLDKKRLKGLRGLIQFQIMPYWEKVATRKKKKKKKKKEKEKERKKKKIKKEKKRKKKN